MIVCFTNDDTTDVRMKVAEATLARYGMKIEREYGSVTGVWIGQSIQPMTRIMQTSVYFEGWAGVYCVTRMQRKAVIVFASAVQRHGQSIYQSRSGQ